MNRARRHALTWLARGLTAAGGWPLAINAAQAAPAAVTPIKVVASFTILADMVREIGAEAVQVSALVGPNGNAHAFEPRPIDLKTVAGADLLVLNGLHFDAWIDRLVKASGYRGRQVVATDGIEPRRVGLSIDPHAWHDLRHAQRYMSNLGAALAQVRPAQAAEIRRRAADYAGRIEALDREIRAQVQAIPPARRRVMSTHDAFGYLGAAYGIEFLAPQGWNADSEPSAAQVAGLIRQIRQQKVAAVFIENISQPRLMQRIAAEGGVKIGGTLYSDALSPPGSEADTFLKLIRHNASTLLAGMRG